MDFLSLKTKNDLCQYLNISENELNYVLYSNKVKYDIFYIKKKNGKDRQISNPCKQLKYIQHKLYLGFEEFYYKYNDFDFVHGFLKNKSIVSNAEAHVGKKYVLNLDICDFFPSITFKRVHGVLTSKKGFNFPNDLAIIIANLVTNAGSLPQGASTSPIISNIVCHNLDSFFRKWMNNNPGIIYSRYADDISFSCDNDSDLKKIYDKAEKKLTKFIIDIFDKNGFSINENKTRLFSYIGHQEVTGINVNSKLNVNKHYIYKLRSMIHSWEKYGLENAYKCMCIKNKNEFNPNDKYKYSEKIIGMLSYMKMVKGDSDSQYSRLAQIVNILLEKTLISYKANYDETKQNSFFQLYGNMSASLGTCFRIKDYFVTCKHCLFDKGCELSELDTFKIERDHRTIAAALKPVYVSSQHDLALFDASDYYDIPYITLSDESVKKTDKVYILGYPMAEENEDYSEQIGHVDCFQKLKGSDFYEDNYIVLVASIRSGNSGGPVLNSNYELVGMVCVGNEDNYINQRNGILDVSVIREEIELYEKTKK